MNVSQKLTSIQIVCLVLVVLATYFGTLGYPFQLDDQPNISQNQFIQISSLSLGEFKKAAFKSANHYRPVANISFALNYYFNGLEVRGYHAVNIVIHLLAGIFLFFFVGAIFNVPLIRNKYGESGLIPFFAASIWLAHPLHTQSVTYIVQRMNSMAAMFFIMAMLFYVKARLSPVKTKKILFFSITFVSGILAFGTKQNTATLPFFFLLFEWFFFQDLRMKISPRQVLWLGAAGLVFVFTLYVFLGDSPLAKLTSGYSGRPFTLAQRLLTQPRVVLHYISLLVFPFPGRLNLDYDFPLSYTMVSPAVTFFSLMLLAVLLWLGVYFLKTNRLYSFCIFWFLGNLVIESSVIPLEIIFEHRTYLPSMMTILLFTLLLRHISPSKQVFIASALSLTLLLTFWGYERNKAWRSQITLMLDNYKKSPDKARVNFNLGVAYLNNNNADEAIPYLQEGLRLNNKETKRNKNISGRITATYFRTLGEAYKDKRELQKAIFYLHKALEESFTEVDDVFTYYFLGQCYGESMRPKEAAFYFSKALELAKVYKSDVKVQAIMSNIINYLNKTELFLKAQKERRIN
jgi:hypothetical protein